MWLIIGLGNPGSKYLLTRHNVGFMAIDNFAQGLTSTGNPPPAKLEHSALTCRFKIDDEDVLLAKPQTFMNNSGESVIPLLQFYKISLEKILVIQDELDLPFGELRFHKNRGHGGNNGIRSIHEKLGHADYARLKIGVGRPANPKMDPASHLLQAFSPEEQTSLTDILNTASDAVESFIFEGLERAGSKFNRRIESDAPTEKL